MRDDKTFSIPSDKRKEMLVKISITISIVKNARCQDCRILDCWSTFRCLIHSSFYSSKQGRANTIKEIREPTSRVSHRNFPAKRNERRLRRLMHRTTKACEYSWERTSRRIRQDRLAAGQPDLDSLIALLPRFVTGFNPGIVTRFHVLTRPATAAAEIHGFSWQHNQWLRFVFPYDSPNNDVVHGVPTSRSSWLLI